MNAKVIPLFGGKRAGRGPDGVHLAHCCPRHGCKYAEPACPVARGHAEPLHSDNNGCEQCEEDE